VKRDPWTRIAEALAVLDLELPPNPPEDPITRACVVEDWKRDVLEPRWKALVREHHPDRGGNTAKMAKINAAHDVLVNLVVPAPARRSRTTVIIFTDADITSTTSTGTTRGPFPFR
jgi:hypothetical protein